MTLRRSPLLYQTFFVPKVFEQIREVHVRCLEKRLHNNRLPSGQATEDRDSWKQLGNSPFGTFLKCGRHSWDGSQATLRLLKSTQMERKRSKSDREDRLRIPPYNPVGEAVARG